MLALFGTSTPSGATEPPPGPSGAAPAGGRVLTGRDALGDWTTDAPGVRRKITVDDLAPPFETPSVDNGPRRMAARPKDAWPRAPQGFNVSEFAIGLNNPRKIITAPNGDIFVAESYPGRVRVLRDADGDGKPEVNAVYASGLGLPFGIAFYPLGDKPTHVYVANTDSVVRFAYKEGDTKAQGKPETVVPNLPGFARLRGGGHWTRDVVFSLDGKRMFVSVGSHSNVSDDEAEKRRADILVFDPEGKGEKVFAWGIRNAVGLAIHPQTGQVWASVNERDALGDHLVPDYVTHVEEGGFYGWPWYYIGAHQDPRHKGKHPELKDKVIVPDVLLQSHSASLCMTFYTGQQFPETYRNDAFAAEHGSWNRARRTGYKVIRLPMKDGKATGEYEDFLVGFVTKEGQVWGRPVGVAVAKDGSLLVTDDGSGTIWRVNATQEK
jgi:glucose/arabinose dehydrogenase